MKSFQQTKKQPSSPNARFHYFNLVFSYFSFFQYPPSFDEIYLFYSEKISKDKLQNGLDRQIGQNKILTQTFGEKKHYCLSQNRVYFRIFEKRRIHALRLLSSFRFKLYIQILSVLPWIQFVGISGSVAMMNAKKGDDIDLFIISSSYRMWTSRILSILLAEVLGFRRRRHDKNTNGKVCLNLFFDGCDVMIPAHKKNIYIAHEIIQLWPLINKQDMYYRFLRENEKWMTALFPNSALGKSAQKKFAAPIFTPSAFENIAHNLQQYFINKHKSSEYLTQTQLWFFPEDFEEKIKGF